MKIVSGYRHLLTREYFSIYLLFFFVFFAIGALNENTALFYATLDNGEVWYGILLSICAAGDVFLPLLSGMLTVKFGAVKVSVVYFLVACAAAVLLSGANSMMVITGMVILISFARTVFNFSCGSVIGLRIDDADKSKFFAVRDIFLFGAIAAALWISGIFSARLSLKHVIAAEALVLLVPVIMLSLSRRPGILSGSLAEEEAGESFFGKIGTVMHDRDFRLFALIQLFLAIDGCVRAYLPFLALALHMDDRTVLNSFAVISVFNAVAALFTSSLADDGSKRMFFLFDIASELVPVTLYWVSKNAYIFIAALFLSAVKDIFAPVTFAYKYEVFNKKDGNIYIAMLESMTSLFAIVLPVPVGFLWRLAGHHIFGISFVSILCASLLILRLPDTNPQINRRHD